MALYTPVHKEDWAATLQDELDEPWILDEICNIVKSDTYTLHAPYVTDPTAAAVSRSTAYSLSNVQHTDESVTINDSSIIAQVIDRADLTQMSYTDQMEMARRQAILNKEDITGSLFADHAACTDFGTEDLTTPSSAGSSQITVSASNVDDIVRNLRATVYVDNGHRDLERNGLFITWRGTDWQHLEAFAQANGFNLADQALKSGNANGVNLLGATHYVTNLGTANHILAGVKKKYFLGILKGTWGQVMVDENDPGLVSGISVVSRVDFREKVWTKAKPLLFDVNVA